MSEQTEKRKPMLSDKVMDSMYSDSDDPTWHIGARDIRDWYEAKIASGELIVVKTAVNMTDGTTYFACSLCKASTAGKQPFNYCPGCGAKIVA